MKHILIFVVSFLTLAECYKILIYNPKFGISHVNFMGKIADILAQGGHDVVIYQPVLNENITFSGSKHKSIRYYNKPRNFSVAPDFTMSRFQSILWQEQSFMKMKDQQKLMFEMKFSFCRDVINDEKNLAALRKENFDLGISEIFESCGFGVFYAIGLKKYIVAHGGGHSSLMMDLLGLQIPFSYAPAMFGESTDQMSYFERVKNLPAVVFELSVAKKMFTEATDLSVREKYPDFDLNGFMKNSAFIYVNSDEFVDYTLPTTSKLIYIGGMGKQQSKPLNEEYQKIFDNAKQGVILLSFGSVVRSSDMTLEIKQAFIHAFAEFPDINFLWKYEEDDNITAGYKNIFTGKWLPQPDILDQDKLLAFISHGGMNSVSEGATKGVPMICIPVFADQGHNAQLLVRRGTALVLNKMKLTKENIVKAIKQIISDKSYKTNAKLLSRMVKSKPMSADERILKFAEFAAQFGDSGALQTQGRHMNAFQLYSLDVVLLFVVGLILALIIITWVVKKSWCLAKKFICTKPKNNADSKAKKRD
uniref:UDP-glucuronosyltransferase n=1 Tax=Panagrolaimus sp. JU765 TaxID=591449 RepID=A0AC34R6N1_9BILA